MGEKSRLLLLVFGEKKKSFLCSGELGLCGV